jgi:hypothetical protein
VHRAGVGQEADDGAQDLLEVQRRADRRDDRVQEPVLTGMGARRADTCIVSRIPPVVRRSVCLLLARRLEAHTEVVSVQGAEWVETPLWSPGSLATVPHAVASGKSATSSKRLTAP